MPGQWHRTKIICTLGPASEQPELLERMIEAGMDVARFNTAHGDPQEHAKRIRLVRDVAKRAGATVAILVDLPGPKLRVGILPEGERKLHSGAKVTVTAGTSVEAGAIPITYPALGEEINPGEPIFLADGAVELKVNSINGNQIAAEVVIGGRIRSGAGVNLPASKLSVALPTKEDQELQKRFWYHYIPVEANRTPKDRIVAVHETQRRFWSLYHPNEVLWSDQARIGAKYLRQNRELFVEAALSI